MKIKQFKENLWTSTRLKLDIIASIFVFFILFSFSYVVYKLLTEDIIFQISPVFRYLEVQDNFNSSQFFNDLQNQTLFLLIVSDIVIFIVSMFFFDRMVKRMLKPIEYVTNLQKRFASNVSHELRTPLSIMNMRGEILMSKIEKEEAKENNNTKFISEAKEGTQVILKEITNLTEIIDDLLFEARIKYSSNKIENITVERLKNILKKASNNQTHLKGEEVDFKVKTEYFESGEYIKANPLHIERIFNNLVSNSFKFTHTGEVVVILEKYRHNHKNYLKIIIKDTGIGISETDLPKISERFYRGKAKENEVSGTGIGLSIVKDIVNNYKWNINIKSKEGNGTMVEIEKITLY